MSVIIFKLQLTHALIEKPGEVEMEAYKHIIRKNLVIWNTFSFNIILFMLLSQFFKDSTT